MDMGEKKKPSILVVEDDAEMCETLSDILSDKGYEVKTAGRGEEGLALARKEKKKFPICLLDLKLPDITGVEVLKGLKALNPDTYAIIITAFASKETVIEALKAGAYYYIEKTLNMEELFAAIEHASAEHQLLEDKRRAEEELRRSEEEYCSLMESTEDSVYMVSRDCRYLFISDKHLSRLGLSIDKVRGRGYDDFHSEEETKEFAEKVEEVFETGKSAQYEHRSRRDGKYFLRTLSPVKDSEGRATAVTVISKDITELKRREEEVEKSRKFLASIIDNIPDAVTIRDSQHRFVLVNQTYCNISRHTKEEVIGKTAYGYGGKTKEIFQTGKELYIPERTYTDLEGKRHYVSVKKAPIADESGEVTHVVTISRDITKHKQANKERERLLKELKAKNAEMERFTYTVSHDLRSPLVTIQGFAGMLRKDLGRDEKEKVEDDLKYIENGATKMEHLLNDTLELSRIGRVVNPPEDVPFGELVQEALEGTSAKIKSSGVEVSVAEDLPAVHVDRMRIAEVLVNLIENSINYMGKQSHPKIDIGYRIDDGESVFFVRDNGIGIEPSQHEKVFGLFYHVERNKGTGAGLATVKRIIEVHGGRVWIESERGKGCSVCFTLLNSIENGVMIK